MSKKEISELEIEEVEIGLISAGNLYTDTGNAIQDLDRCYKVEYDYYDYYFETRRAAAVWIRKLE